MGTYLAIALGILIIVGFWMVVAMALHSAFM
jgi:hypothetical protein